MTPKSVKKKLKQPSFAAAVNREELRTAPRSSGVDFDEHLAFVIEALAAKREALMPERARGACQGSTLRSLADAAALSASASRAVARAPAPALSEDTRRRRSSRRLADDLQRVEQPRQLEHAQHRAGRADDAQRAPLPGQAALGAEQDVQPGRVDELDRRAGRRPRRDRHGGSRRRAPRPAAATVSRSTSPPSSSTARRR